MPRPDRVGRRLPQLFRPDVPLFLQTSVRCPQVRADAGIHI